MPGPTVLFNVALSHFGESVQKKSDQHPPLRGTSMLTRHQGQGAVIIHHRGQAEKSRSITDNLLFAGKLKQLEEAI